MHEGWLFCQLIDFGWHRTPPGHIYGPGTRNYCLIHVVVSGEGKLVSDNVEYTVKKGHCFLIRPNQLCYYESSRQDPWEYYYFGFYGKGMDEVLKDMGFYENVTVRKVDLEQELYRKFGELCDTVDCFMSPYFYQSVLCGLIHLFVEMTNNDKQDSQHASVGKPLVESQSPKDYVKMAIGIIHQNYRDAIDTPSIASRLSISPRYLNTLFKKQTGQTVHEYLMNYRLTTAKEQLALNDKAIKWISVNAGFKDPLYFSTFFRKATGMSPQKYRQHERQQKEVKEIGDERNLCSQ